MKQILINKLSIIIPVYNEEKTILNILNKVCKFVADRYTIEKIYVRFSDYYFNLEI